MSEKKRQHAIGVGRAIAHFNDQGFSVFIPVSDINRYDLIVDDGDGLKRVEVKTTSSATSDVPLRTLGGNQSWSGEVKRISSLDCDLVFCLNVTTGSFKIIPSKELEGKTSIRVR